MKPAFSHALVSSVTATYPGFGGTSVLDVVSIPDVGLPVAHNQDFDSNPPVDSGNVTGVSAGALLFGVVFNTNIANFQPSGGWPAVPGATQSGGAGAGRRNITPVYMVTGGPPADYAVTGNLVGPPPSGFWQAAIPQFQPSCFSAEHASLTRFRGSVLRGPAPDSSLTSTPGATGDSPRSWRHDPREKCRSALRTVADT